jgi:DNA mismatch endonuclease (patch repair protein)
MADITDAATRSRMMSGIRGRDTQPELVVRRTLHATGLRFRLHYKGLPGKPDLVFPRHKAVVLVHGCFWHQHGCANSKLPKSRPEFWLPKLQSNVERDERTNLAIREAGWRVATIWECTVRRAAKNQDATVFLQLADWIRQGVTTALLL